MRRMGNYVSKAQYIYGEVGRYQMSMTRARRTAAWTAMYYSPWLLYGCVARCFVYALTWVSGFFLIARERSTTGSVCSPSLSTAHLEVLMRHGPRKTRATRFSVHISLHLTLRRAANITFIFIV